MLSTALGETSMKWGCSRCRGEKDCSIPTRRDPRGGCGSILCSGEKFKEAALEMGTRRICSPLPTANVALREGHS